MARGLSGVRLVISDDHAALGAAIAAVLPGASWRRCRTHFVRNLLTRVPESAHPFVATLVRSIFAQLSREEVEAQHAGVVEQLEGRYRSLVTRRRTSWPSACYPQSTGARPGRTTLEERLNREVRRRTDVVGIVPDWAAVIRLVGAVLAEQHEEWAVARRAISAESLAKARRAALETDRSEEVMPVLAAAGSLRHLVRMRAPDAVSELRR